MRKKLDTRFPAARIKKIMQADEDVGKIALAVPVLMSKALELFLQDLCERTYGITVQTGARTVSSLHLKHCVQRYSIFDFLREVVSKVPDYTHSGSSGEVRTISRRRKVAGEELSDSDEQLKRSRMQETSHTTGGGRGRGRSRGRGRGRVGRVAELDQFEHDIEPELSTPRLDATHASRSMGGELPSGVKEEADGLSNPVVQKFDLNAEIKENEIMPAMAVPDSTSLQSAIRQGNPDMPLTEIDRIEINPLQLGSLNSTFDDEDYDEDM